MTVLFLALVTIEMTDIIFALDSIPAVLAITRDPFIAYTSNVFAILGLRSLYFALSPLLKKFTYLNWGLATILVFVGIKMLLSGVFTMPLGISLLIIVLILTVTAFLSWKFPRKKV
jgi:tellurite resistance protein TerC